MSADHNPPAFPNDPRVQLGDDYQGMTLRDWFAGQVAPSIVLAPTELSRTPTMEETANIIAKASYLIADAMLAARKETP